MSAILILVTGGFVALALIYHLRPGWLLRGYRTYYSEHAGIQTRAVEIAFSDDSERYSQLQCNDDRILYTCMPEVRHLEEMFKQAPPNTVLEIGGGIGRASVYFRKRFDWYATRFYMLDGDSGDYQHREIGSGAQDEFYNSFDATRRFCAENGIEPERLTMLDASTPTWKAELKELRFDYIYSFLAIGFHWGIEQYLSDLRPHCRANTRLIFGMRGTDRGNRFARAQSSYATAHSEYRIVENVRESELYRGSVLVLAPV